MVSCVGQGTPTHTVITHFEFRGNKMKEINPAVKFILASGYLDPHLKSEILKSGAKDFIQKPYVVAEILRRIREVIDTP